MATLRLLNVKQRRPRKTAKEKGVKEMMEKLERLGRRLLPHPEEGGEQSKPAKGLRWYHKAFVVPALALAIVAGGLAFPNQAEAHHSGYWWQHPWDNSLCFSTQDHYTGSYAMDGCGYWQGGIFYYYPLRYSHCYYYISDDGVTWYGLYKDPFCAW
jgi:hypothetical protein